MRGRPAWLPGGPGAPRPGPPPSPSPRPWVRPHLGPVGRSHIHATQCPLPRAPQPHQTSQPAPPGAQSTALTLCSPAMPHVWHRRPHSESSRTPFYFSLKENLWLVRWAARLERAHAPTLTAGTALRAAPAGGRGPRGRQCCPGSGTLSTHRWQVLSVPWGGRAGAGGRGLPRLPQASPGTDLLHRLLEVQVQGVQQLPHVGA